jgi:hypothetical protein
MALFIPAETSLPVREVMPENEQCFALQELYQLLSCNLIERIHLENGCIMVCDEESKLTQKPRNERATQLAGFVSPKELIAKMLRLHEAGVQVFWMGEEPLSDEMTEVDSIAGDVLLCAHDEIR